jgi:hypothetical protein
MKSLHTQIDIEAPASKVWNILMDHANFPQWNPFIKEVNGETQVGNQIEINLDMGKGKNSQFKPTVLVRDTNKEFRWIGHLFINGLFDGEHYFQLEELGPNRTRLIHGEKFSGILSGTIMKMIGETTEKGFISMNVELKKLAEA